MYVKRSLARELVRLSGTSLGRGLILTGARQTGKTTLLEHELVPPYELYSFDEPITRAELLARPASAWIHRGRSYIFDEVQKAPDFLGTVKVILDRGGAGQRVILSGSAQIQLLSGVRETLAGRVVTLELYPLLAGELAGTGGPTLLEALAGCATSGEARQLLEGAGFAHEATVTAVREAFDEILHFGGMPRLVTLSDLSERWIWLREYCATYLQRDVADLGRVADLDDFFRLQRVAARRTAGLVNFADMARDADMAPLTAKRYLRHLELSYQAFLLPAYRRPGRRLAKAPRLHWVDLGIQRILSGQREGVTGEQLETAVVAEALKTLRTARTRAELLHLRTHDGREVDLLIRVPNGGYLAVEVKSSPHPAPVHARHLRGLEDLLDGPLLASLVVHPGHRVTTLPGGVIALPPAVLFAPVQ